MGKHFCKWTIIVAMLPVLMGSNACAISSGAAFGGKHNSKTPIEVTSDALEVMQQQNKAVFTGHVVAIQGDVRLTAEKMTVFYAGAADKKAGKNAADRKSKSGNPQGAIKKIEAE